MLSIMMLLASLAGSAAPPAAPQDTAHIVVVATTDVHGRATDWDYVTGRPFPGGLVRAATVIDSIRKRYPGQVVVVDAGDLLQGDPFAAYFASVSPRDPNPIIEAMNLIGYDAATLGNHDFNWGLPFLRRSLAGATFPYVSGNVFGLPADTLVYPPYVVLRRQGIRVGIAGFTTPGVMVWDRENVRGQTRVGPIGAAAPGVLRDMARESDLRIVLIHSGMDEASSYDTTAIGAENVAARLAGITPAPDLVLVGHSHREMADSVIDGVHFIQPKNWAQQVAVAHIDLVRRNGRWQVARIRGELVPLAGVAPSPLLASRLAAAQRSAQDWVAQPLGQASGPMLSAMGRAEPTAIVNFINDVQRKRTGAQLSATSVFNPASGFRGGPITLADLAGVYPYENTLRAVKLSGAALKAFLEHSSRYYRTDSLGHVSINDSVAGYNFDIVGGASYEMDLRLPVGERIRNLTVGGRPVAPTDTFTFAVNSYRQAGGGGYAMLAGAPVVYDRSENIRDVLADEIRARGTLDPAEFTRTEWSIVPAEAAAEARTLAGAPAPARNPRAAAGAPGDSVLLRVLAIGDFHGALVPKVASWSHGRLGGGAAALKATMDSAAAHCGGCPVVRLDAGDEMQGTLESNLVRGRSVIEVFNRMGIQAAAIGNHDFDWSVDTLRQRMAESRYPWLASNIFDSTTGRRPVWAVPYRIIPVGQLRVAVIGWITPETKTIVKAPNVRNLRFAAGAAAIRDVLDQVRAERPDVTILVAHSGATCDSLSCSGEILDLARELGPAVDMIVAGHTHRLVNTVVGNVHVVEARSSGTALAVMDLLRTPVGSRVERADVESIYDDVVTPDTGIARIVASYSARTDSLARTVVAQIKLPLLKAGDDGQYPLGNLIADAYRNAVRADLGLMNNGGIRGAGLNPGPLTYGALFELSPFQNNLVRVTVTGAVVRQVMEHALESGKPDAHIAGFTVRYDPARPVGHRVVEMRLADGHRMDDRRTYTLGTLDFMQMGGSGYSMLIHQPVERGFGVDVDALLAYFRRLPQPVEAPEAPRITPVAAR